MLSKIGLKLILGGIAVCGIIAVFNLHLPFAEWFFMLGVAMILIGVFLKIFFGKMPQVSDNQAGTSHHGSGADP